MTETSTLCGKMLLEMERFEYRAGEEDQGAVALVLYLAKAFERVSLPVVWAWATHFSFPRKILLWRVVIFEGDRSIDMRREPKKM